MSERWLLNWFDRTSLKTLFEKLERFEMSLNPNPPLPQPTVSAPRLFATLLNALHELNALFCDAAFAALLRLALAPLLRAESAKFDAPCAAAAFWRASALLKAAASFAPLARECTSRELDTLLKPEARVLE